MHRKLSSNEIEAANRGEVSALLIRLGYQIYRPEADVDGVDLVLRQPSGDLVSVQLKSRLTVNWKLYGGRGIWMLFPGSPWDADEVRRWYLMPHDLLFQVMEKRHGHAPKWDGSWSVAKPAKDLLGFLEKTELRALR
ncbi:hypothetical protein EH31_14220 [Erythrobacter longus]|uniref:Endonuclease n=1 Tax=Erythrobacter longus TaxID=1044 RepID=A0A074M8V5_ERYLO|nr:hypothetical protein [Erythrobacter longus]KEO89185.1 hypothetical protein EH31_14220 [Erythrobacter longus]